MGSRDISGNIITQSGNLIRVHSQGNSIKVRNTFDDTLIYSVASTGIDNTTAISGAFRFGPSSMSLAEQTVDHSVEYAKFLNASGNLGHVVTRAEGIHTSVSSRGVANSGTSLGPMVTETERKVFFIDNDRNLAAASQADWTIFSSSGVPVGSSDGVTDTDVSPNVT